VWRREGLEDKKRDTRRKSSGTSAEVGRVPGLFRESSFWLLLANCVVCFKLDVADGTCIAYEDQ